MTQLTQWTPEQIDSLAPDDQVVKAARGLARPAKWYIQDTEGRAIPLNWVVFKNQSPGILSGSQ